MTAGRDRLSDLNDDVLRRILHFVPAREGASTSALSRRWSSSPLWRSSGAVNLEICLPGIQEYNEKRDAIISRVHQALDAADKAGVPVTRLTFRVESRSVSTINEFFYCTTDDRIYDVVAGVISHPVARHVEELRIAAVVPGAVWYEMDYGLYSHSDPMGIYLFRLDSLSSETLRVLELTNCSGFELPPSSAISFPRLALMRLRHCRVALEVLQGVIDAAPVLAVIHIESVLLEDSDSALPPTPEPKENVLLRLSCPAAAVLVLDRCSWMKEACMKIDAPRLRRFRYSGALRQISLTPPSPGLVLADLTLLRYTIGGDEDPRDVRRNFWRFIRSYTHAREMKLRVRHLEEIAIASEARRVQLLPEFRNLVHLELEGVHRPTGKTAAVAIANLLRCCPALRDLRIKLTTSSTPRRSHYEHDFLEKRYRSDLQDSINRFKRHQREPVAAGDEDEDVKYDDIPDILALSGRSFECLRSCLRRVGLQFRQQKTDCFGVKLIKFFAENSMVLEEVCIDSGTEKMCNHLNPKIEKWISNSSKRRKTDSTNSTNIVVSPLERRN